MGSEEAYGRSLVLDHGDIVLVDGSLRMLSGRQNLLQALELRVVTPYGSDVFNTTYGMDIREAFTRPGEARRVKDLIRLSLVRTLTTDPRVREVTDVVFEDDPRFLELHPQLDEAAVAQRLRDRRRRFWEVEVLFDAVSGDSESIRLEIGI